MPELPISFYGSELTDEECDAIGLKNIKPKYIKKEAMLYSKKWFDYRRMHPVKATYLFAHYYTQAFNKMMKKRNGEHDAYRKGFSGGDPMRAKAGQNTGFYRARQYADLLGIPYDFYCAFAMEWHSSRLWTRLPKSYHLYSRDFLKAVKTAWDEVLTETIVVPESDFYMADGYYEHKDQVEFQHWLLKLIKTRKVPEMALATYMFLNEYLIEGLVREYFDDSIIQKAIKI